MAVTQFEAAVLYDCENQLNTPREGTVVVLDVDALEVGICSCSATGEVVLLDRTGSATDGAELKRQRSGGYTKSSVFNEEWKRQSGLINEQLKKYFFSNGQMDLEAFQIPSMEIAWSCSQLEEQFRGTKEALEQSFQMADDILTERKIDEDKLRFLIVGEEAGYYLFLHCIKSYYSFNPFMADNRFAEEGICRNAEKLTEEWNRKQEQSMQIGHDIRLNYFEWTENQTLIERSEILSEKTQPMAAFKEVRFSQPVFVEKGGRLSLSVDGNIQKMMLPFSGGSGIGDNVEVGVCAENQKLKLRIRKAREASDYYDVELF